ncbi:transglutaminase domain-containing protein [Alteribacillus sp. HJP-4]|uniref:transglutaminase family protein n=1 Tax=Alteribacillus sp. HJP-4 TaxID=2775394 RepID=UPI0035CD04C3
MKYNIEHINTFYYDNPVDQSMNEIRLKPRSDECQRLLEYRSELTPSTLTKEHTDIWGNHVETFFIAEKHSSLEVKTTSTVSIQKSPFLRMVKFSPEMKEIFYSEMFRNHYLSFLNDTPFTFLYKNQYEDILKQIGDIENPIEFSIELMRWLHEQIYYDGSATNVMTKAHEAFPLRKGVCQDYTHIMLGALRARGIPARYVSGYLYVGENSALVGDSATHAWVEVMMPGIGWAGLDPTNNVEALEQHIRVGTGRDYADVSPFQGMYRGGQQTLDVKVSVQLINN